MSPTRSYAKRLPKAGLGVAAATLLSLVLLVPAASNSSDEELAQRRAQAAADLVEARSQLTFDLLEPGWLPDGYSLETIAWFAPDEKIGNTASAVDAWYTAPGRPTIHVWQTDNPVLGRKDPVAAGERFQHGNAPEWSMARGLRNLDSSSATQISFRLPGAITVSVDSGIAAEDLIRVVESLTSNSE